MRRRPSGRKKSETGLVSKKDPSQLPRRKFSLDMCCQPRHTMQAMCPESGADRHTAGVPEYQPHATDFSEFRGGRGDMSTNGSLGSFGGSELTIAQVRETNSPVSFKCVTIRSVVDTFIQKFHKKKKKNK